MGEESQGAAVGGAGRFAVDPGGSEIIRGDEQRGHQGGGEQEHAHDERSGEQEPVGVADLPLRARTVGVGGIAFDQGHHRHARFKAGQAEGQLGEQQQRDADHRQGVGVGGEQGRVPVHEDVRVADNLAQAVADDDDVERQVGDD